MASALSQSISESAAIHFMIMAVLITAAGIVARTGVLLVLLTSPLAALAIRHQRTERMLIRAVHETPPDHPAGEGSLGGAIVSAEPVHRAEDLPISLDESAASEESGAATLSEHASRAMEDR